MIVSLVSSHYCENYSIIIHAFLSGNMTGVYTDAYRVHGLGNLKINHTLVLFCSETAKWRRSRQRRKERKTSKRFRLDILMCCSLTHSSVYFTATHMHVHSGCVWMQMNYSQWRMGNVILFGWWSVFLSFLLSLYIRKGMLIISNLVKFIYYIL